MVEEFPNGVEELPVTGVVEELPVRTEDPRDDIELVVMLELEGLELVRTAVPVPTPVPNKVLDINALDELFDQILEILIFEDDPDVWPPVPNGGTPVPEGGTSIIKYDEIKMAFPPLDSVIVVGRASPPEDGETSNV